MNLIEAHQMPLTNLPVRQAHFDQALQHLRTQGKRSANGTRCLYRGPDNTKCAVGALIPDPIFIPRMEGLAVKDLLRLYPEIVELFQVPTNEDGVTQEAETSFYTDMQINMHDDLEQTCLHCGLTFHEALEKVADKFAQRWNLTYTKPN